jgi:hypothetical protein
VFVKRRPHAVPGTIPHALDMFRNEVRFYLEVAPAVGVRVAACFVADESDDGFRLELEDLGGWSIGSDPVAVAEVLRVLHERWVGRADDGRWPWLRPPAAAAELIAELYERTWPSLSARSDLSPAVREVGASFVGRIVELERAEGEGPLTLIHGDASARNVRTSPTGEVALLDWEDVRLAPGAVDLAWWLLTSVEPRDWDAVLDASSATDRACLVTAMPTAISQALLSLADLADGAPESAASIARMDAAIERERW